MTNNQGVCLAAMDGFGQIYDCGSCGNIHVQVGPVTLTLEPKAYMQFVALVSTSAANFELWLEAARGPITEIAAHGSSEHAISETHTTDRTPDTVSDTSNLNEKGTL